jgi:hypothetical protein
VAIFSLSNQERGDKADDLKLECSRARSPAPSIISEMFDSSRLLMNSSALHPRPEGLIVLVIVGILCKFLGRVMDGVSSVHASAFPKPYQLRPLPEFFPAL